MDYKRIDELSEFGCSVLKDEPLCRHTSFKIGGPADRFVTAYTREQLARTLAAAKGLPLMMLGKGTNVLVGDKGYRGIIIILDGDFKKLSRNGNRITAGAGASISALCCFARDEGFTGLEFAYGIPGSAGGALYMNAGAYGGELSDIAVSCEAVDMYGQFKKYYAADMGLSYRSSRFQKGDLIITSLTLELKPGNSAEINTTMQELMSRRVEKQPYTIPSGGSTFKRPVGAYASALIEECGLKGYTSGGAQVSEKHGGFVVNTGTASCGDVLDVIDHVKRTVLDKKGIALECEIRMIGSD